MAGPSPPPLTDAYQKARRQYGLFSALLIVWELIGIEVPKVPVAGLNITLKSPEAAPFVLIALIGYFAFRITIEWYQSIKQRRSMRASRVDFLVAHGLGASALLLYVIQRSLEFQVFDKINQQRLWFLVFLAGGSAGGVLKAVIKGVLKSAPGFFWSVVAMTVACHAVIIWLVKELVLGGIIIYLVGFVIALLLAQPEEEDDPVPR